MKKIKATLLKMYENLSKHKSALLVMACLVVFITTYVLILPAFTLDKEKAAEQGGIDVPAVETAAETGTDEAGEAAAEEEEETVTGGEDAAAEQKKEDTETPAQGGKTEAQADGNGLIFEADDYSVTVTDTNNVLPENACVEVEEITNDKKAGKAMVREYEKLYEDALAAVAEEDKEGSTVDFRFAKFYDISITDGGDAIEPEDAVSVSIAYEKKLQKMLRVADADKVRIVHFARDKKTGEVTPEVLDSKKVDITTDNKKMTEAAFEADSFSVYAVVYLIDSTYVSASGDTYDIKVTYGEDANIPKGTELEIKEIRQDSNEYNEYANEAWLKMNESGFRNFLQAVFFDISLVYDGKEIEPEAPVQVSIELKEGLTNSKKAETAVVHFAEDGPEIISDTKVTEKGNKVTGVEFEQGSFSVDGLITAVEANGTIRDNSPIPKAASRALDASELPPPQATKTKSDNGDGTYKITLNVNGTSQSTEKVTKSNVIIVLDESTSMHFGQYIQITNATNGVLGPGFSIDPDLRYFYAPAEGYVSSSVLNPFGTPHVTTYDLRVNNGRLYRGNSLYTGPVYVFKSRLEAEQEALQILFHDLLAYNKPGQTTADGVSMDDIIEIELVGFNNGAWVEQQWTTSEDTLNSAIANIDLANETHWWDAYNTARTEATRKRQQQPNEDVHIIFLTDGEPMQITYTLGIPSGTTKNWNACLTAARNMHNLLEDYAHLYNIFTYGEMQDLNPVADRNPVNPRNTAENGWAGRYPKYEDLRTLTNYAYDLSENSSDKYTGKYFFNAKTIEEVREALGSIFSNIIESVAYGCVSLTDGLTSHASATTVVNGKADGFTYKVSGNNNYTVTATGTGGNPTVTFTIGSEVITTDTKTTVTDPADPTKTYDVYQVTASNGSVYKMTLADIVDGEVKWDLSGLGVLEDGCNYSVSFDMWPNQEAYDTLADLNNGLKTWDENKQHEVNITRSDGTTLTYYTNDEPEYTDIVKYPDGTYAVLTNSKQELQYSVATTVSGSGGEGTTFEGPFTDNLDMPDPMPLDDRKVKLQKEWNDSLDPTQLNDIVKEAEEAGTPFHAELSLQKDGDDYITPVIIEPVKDDAGNVQRTWPEVDESGTAKKHDVSAGLMVSEAQAKESGLYQWISNDSKYKQVRFPDEEDGTLYFILDTGHDYSFYEDPAHNDHHFELAENVFHPMLVDKVLMDVEFNEDGSIKDMKPVTTGDDGTATLTATNDLKGGIRVYKKIFDETGRDITDQKNSDKFTVKVDLNRPDGSPYEVTAKDGGYRINYGPNNPDKGAAYYDDDGNLVNYGRESSRHPITNGTFTVELYAGDFVQVSNVDRNVTYQVTELTSAIPDGYELIGIDYYKDGTVINDHPEERVIEPNTSHQVIVKNRSSLTDFSFSKAWLKTGTDLDDIAEADLLEWTTDKSIDVEIKRLKADNSKDNTFKLTYHIDIGDGPFQPTDAGLSDEEKIGYQLTRTDDGKISTFDLGKVLPGKYKKGDEEKAYTYYVEEVSAGEGSYTAYYGSVNDGAISRDLDAQNATDGMVIINMESPAELPHAGGIGTTLFYVLGSILAIGCAIFLISRRRLRGAE